MCVFFLKETVQSHLLINEYKAQIVQSKSSETTIAEATRL